MKRPTARFSPNAMEAMVEYEWPGNVRELENRIKRAVVMGEGRTGNNGRHSQKSKQRQDK